MSRRSRRITILQTGRLGDLWYTTPLANHLHRRGTEVEVAYNAVYGNPFTFFPYVRARPMACRPRFGHGRIAYALNEAWWQADLYRRLRGEGRRVIWNQIFPYRWAWARLQRKTYPEIWYRRYPQVDFRYAPSTLPIDNDRTILVFLRSQSLGSLQTEAEAARLLDRLRILAIQTAYRPVVVAYGDQPDHPDYETWRGDLTGYQRRIAGCGMVFGVVTSAHVLGQLLGKPVHVLYPRGTRTLNRIPPGEGAPS